MAIFTPGPMAGQISGRVGSVVFSHNRGGTYVRNGTIPIKIMSEAALAAKARLATSSNAWQALTDAQRAAWVAWAQANSVTNRLGHAITLTGIAAFNSLNTRLRLALAAPITAPPIIPPPNGLLTLTQQGDIGAGAFGLTFTATPLSANVKLWIQACVTNSGAIEYVQNLIRYCGVSAAAQASPFDHQALIEARLGALVVGQTVTSFVSTFDTVTGQLSRPLRVQTVVTSTP